MKAKILNSLLILTSLMGYLEWGGNNHIMLFEAEAEIILKLFSDPQSVLHPFILIPLAGQFVLLITLFQKTPNKILTFICIGGLGILLAFMFLIGIMTLNYKIIISTLPFLILSIYSIIFFRKNNA